MLFRIAADTVLLIHLAFVVFVVLGGLLALRWPWVILAHLPAAIWGALIEFQGWICPLTPLEQRLLHAAGEQGYAGGFVEHYVLPIIYPAQLTRSVQIVLGVIVVVVNLAIYTAVFFPRIRNRIKTGPSVLSREKLP